MAPFIATTVQWVILPLIMCAIFAFAWIIAGSAKTAELRVSSWAGFWAGLLSFVIYVVSQLSQIREPNLHYAALPDMQFLPLGWGLTTGFVFLWIVRHAVPTRLVGLITLMLAGSSTSAIFTYIFIDSLRVSVLYWTLGTALGILLHIVLFPSSVAHILPVNERKDRFLADAMRNPMGDTCLLPVQQRQALPGQGSDRSIPSRVRRLRVERRTRCPTLIKHDVRPFQGTGDRVFKIPGATLGWYVASPTGRKSSIATSKVLGANGRRVFLHAAIARRSAPPRKAPYDSLTSPA
jgi:hypothetical protein